ncbi:bifunctional riboflavin kinase/FAD synthetase [Salinisphaera japonica]|uniref:Riboflavin biosynthesis protein n=1 Tax=Salinisphaera japonica YTM-1 TaxID=1209778 RepID=A0A423PS29_9GAMM|nr:bifunctional riboflavin kinase/FAD synthetase [Salinisphaera japonica]ROO28397.1 FMN adenylyltransferase [Salinisphaera japonica YTM-1]
MQIIRSIRRHPGLAGGCVLTVGNFDGLHLGHQAIIERVRARAAELSLPAVMMSFDPMPGAFFRPDAPPARLTSLREKLEDAAALGIDCFVRARFDAAFAAMSPQTFLEALIAKRLGARAILVGDDFRFGHRRAGDVATLDAFAAHHGIERMGLPDVCIDNERVSSTAVRQALANGQVRQAGRLLGRAYRISERVVGGQRLGRTLGFPTANLCLKRPAALRYGVYAVRVRLADGSVRAGAASFGVRPVVDGKDELLEIYLLDFAADIYGMRLDVEFVDFVRGEENYDSLDLLIEQMNRDVDDVRRILDPTETL